ncbi:MAG: class IV adenylate cyclase [Desulfobacteraceae bacterium]|nr:class IV adenylate cyclase [Desulfobacteraceae bacterium]
METEVKFYLPDPEGIRKRIRDMGAQYKDESFERNIRFEDSGCSLINKNALLRLRRTDSRIELTYKGEPPEKNRDFKVHQELEILVSDFDTAADILKALGFHEEQVYEKHRETWRLGDTVLCMDKMPFGFFFEIEGQPEDIRQIAGGLGLDWEKRILANYLAIFERLKTDCALCFNDVTFENFKNVELDFSDFARLFEQGGRD